MASAFSTIRFDKLVVGEGLSKDTARQSGRRGLRSRSRIRGIEFGKPSTGQPTVVEAPIDFGP